MYLLMVGYTIVVDFTEVPGSNVVHRSSYTIGGDRTRTFLKLSECL